MKHSLANKHALVCGASEGIGRASAFALAELGASVTVLSRRQDRLDEVVAALPCPMPSQVHGSLSADVSDAAALRSRVDSALQRSAPCTS